MVNNKYNDGNDHYRQKNHCNDNCNDFSDFNDIIAPLDKLIMSFIDKTHYQLVLRGAIMSFYSTQPPQ